MTEHRNVLPAVNSIYTKIITTPKKKKNNRTPVNKFFFFYCNSVTLFIEQMDRDRLVWRRSFPCKTFNKLLRCILWGVAFNHFFNVYTSCQSVRRKNIYTRRVCVVRIISQLKILIHTTSLRIRIYRYATLFNTFHLPLTLIEKRHHQNIFVHVGKQ